jgi:antitoxin CptB
MHYGANAMREQLLTSAIGTAISTRPGTSGLLAFGVDGQMTGSTRSSGGLDDRRKRLLFRCWHRGTREMDLILGRFADAEIANLADDELGQLEHLIELPDPDLYAAWSGDAVLAPEYRSDLFDRIRSRSVSSGRPKAGPVGGLGQGL